MHKDRHATPLHLGGEPSVGAIEKATEVHGMFSRIAGRYDLVNALLSGGLDAIWRRRAAAAVRGWAPATILDLATGSGVLALTLARACPAASVTGADFCTPMLQAARRRGLERLVVADAMRLPFADGIFDVVTVAFGLRNMENWSGALCEMRRVLRPGGRLLILDFSLPGGWARGPYRLYLHRCLPSVGAWVSRDKEAYRYLAESIERFPSGPAMRELMAENGFAEGTAEELTLGIVSLYTGVAGGRPGGKSVRFCG